MNCWCVYTQIFFSSLFRDTCVQLLHFCFKYLSYLHCACFNSQLALPVHAERSCASSFIFLNNVNTCENFMKILLYKLWHLFFLYEALNITLLEHVQVKGTQFVASNTRALLLSVSLHSAVFPLRITIMRILFCLSVFLSFRKYNSLNPDATFSIDEAV